MLEESILSYVIGSRIDSTKSMKSKDEPHCLNTISTRTITNLAFIAEYVEIPLALNFMKVPWGVEAAQLLDKLSYLSYLDHIKWDDKQKKWLFCKDTNDIRGQISKNRIDFIRDVDSIIEILSDMNDKNLATFVAQLSENVLSGEPISDEFSGVLGRLEALV